MVDVIHHINHGNDTEKNPLEVILNLTGKVSGDTIPIFSVGFSVGFATAQARLLLLPLVFASCARMQGCR